MMTSERHLTPWADAVEWGEWRTAALHAAPISLSILALFYYWFAVGDRYAVFLYEHLGATPFDEVTSSRYWMSGLVACGIVMVVYVGVNWLLGRISARRQRDYGPPAWQRVWGLCALPLTVGIPVITMSFNWPTLPLANSVACVAATLIGLALALSSGSWAAQRPVDLAWLALDALGLMPVLLLLRAVELPARGLSVPVPLLWLIAIGGPASGVVWLGVMTGLRAWRRRSSPDATTLFVAGVCQSYLLMPLVHHLFSTPPGYRYISTASNFFAFNPGLQLLVFLVAAALAIGATRLRQRFI
jgi:hypothetical protein